MGWDKFEKLVELVKRRISQIVLYRMKDPRIGFVTITKVELSRDLKNCKVYYTVFGSEGESSKTTYALRDARGYIQSAVAKTLRTRIMPKIEFIYDESIAGVERMQQLLDSIQAERPEEGEAGDAGSESPSDDPGEGSGERDSDLKGDDGRE